MWLSVTAEPNERGTYSGTNGTGPDRTGSIRRAGCPMKIADRTASNKLVHLSHTSVFTFVRFLQSRSVTVIAIVRSRSSPPQSSVGRRPVTLRPRRERPRMIRLIDAKDAAALLNVTPR